MLQEEIDAQGFGILPGVLTSQDVADIDEKIKLSGLPRTRAGIRHALRHPAVLGIAHDARLVAFAKEILGPDASPFRATLFDKSAVSNWLVVWHQDTALPLRERREVAGWGPWSIKDQVNYAHAPAGVLAGVVALRLHLDDSIAENGPLRVLPGTHNLGVLTGHAIHELSVRIAPVDCLVARGGILGYATARGSRVVQIKIQDSAACSAHRICGLGALGRWIGTRHKLKHILLE